MITQGRAPLWECKGSRFSLMGTINWAGRTAQVEVTINTVQEGCWAISDVVVEKRTKARGPGHPHRMTKVMRTPTAALKSGCRVWKKMLPKWKQEVATWLITDLSGERPICSMLVEVEGSRRQGRPQFPRDMSGGLPSSWVGSCDQGSNWSSEQSTMMRVSGESNWPAWPGRVKVNLPIFKDEKTKDAITHHSWQWGIAIFCCSGWDDQHLLPYIFQSLQGFLGDLTRNLGEDATLNDILQLLDKHYGVVMTFDALSKELCSLKQGSGGNVAEFRVCLSQQVQILQSKYPGRIQQEHIEEMKWDCFYKGLNPKYWQMLVHKDDGKHLIKYSNLLLADQKLKKWAEARDCLLLNITMTGGLNITHSQISGNLFPSQKLKGSHTFTIWSAMVESNEAEEDSSMKAEQEVGVESSAKEDAGTSSGVGGTDQSVGYIVHFANAVKLYQRKNPNCFRCGSSDHLMKDCPNDLSKTTQKTSLNAKEGMTWKGGWAP